jgi:hypothetical protein
VPEIAGVKGAPHNLADIDHAREIAFWRHHSITDLVRLPDTVQVPL